VKSRRSDDWAAAILEEAKAASASLIVVGVAMRTSDALLFGETANRLLESSSRSLLFAAS
jgi:nucleotide-binding universal stress UspA family protein